jgi:hypothetical protein
MTATTAVVADPVEPPEPTMRSAQQLAEEEGLTFAGTPGPGYSEGGDVYEPRAALDTRSTSRDGGPALARPVVASVG